MHLACDLEVGCHRERPMGQRYDGRKGVPRGQWLHDPAGSCPGPAGQLGGLDPLRAAVVVGGAYQVGPGPPPTWTETS
jgi:hypothetical protein